LAIAAAIISCVAGGIGAGVYLGLKGQYLFAFVYQNEWFVSPVVEVSVYFVIMHYK
jgi:hypothetical protein